MAPSRCLHAASVAALLCGATGIANAQHDVPTASGVPTAIGPRSLLEVGVRTGIDRKFRVLGPSYSAGLESGELLAIASIRVWVRNGVSLGFETPLNLNYYEESDFDGGLRSGAGPVALRASGVSTIGNFRGGGRVAVAVDLTSPDPRRFFDLPSQSIGVVGGHGFGPRIAGFASLDYFRGGDLRHAFGGGPHRDHVASELGVAMISGRTVLGAAAGWARLLEYSCTPHADQLRLSGSLASAISEGFSGGVSLGAYRTSGLIDSVDLATWSVQLMLGVSYSIGLGEMAGSAVAPPALAVAFGRWRNDCD